LHLLAVEDVFAKIVGGPLRGDVDGNGTLAERLGDNLES
jgi:hypothetical protein